MKANFFEWFNLPKQYDIHVDELKASYYRVSKNAHPDNFHHKSKLEQYAAQEALGYTHQAYEVLTCPIKRANYILLLNQIDLQSELVQKKPMPASFLAQIFEWQTQENTQQLKIKLKQSIESKLVQVKQLFAQDQIELAVLPVRELLFMQKVLEQC